MGHRTRADVQWVPAVLFHLVYVTALIVPSVKPGLQRGSVGHAVALGALFGIAAYAAFDLTGPALSKHSPLKGALVDLAGGSFVTATGRGAAMVMGRWLRAASHRPLGEPGTPSRHLARAGQRAPASSTPTAPFVASANACDTNGYCPGSASRNSKMAPPPTGTVYVWTPFCGAPKAST